MLPEPPTSVGPPLLLNAAQTQICSRVLLPLGPGGSDVLIELNPEAPTPFDPAQLPGLPRVDNQYNEDTVTSTNARNHGHCHVASPRE